MYLSILESHLLPQAAIWYQNSQDWTFMQDNAPCHKSKTTMRWFQEKGLKVMDWPPNSPDLNPIENMWGVLKQKLQSLGNVSKTELTRNARKIWSEDESIKALCNTLTESMPKRVMDVIKNHGGAITY